MQKQPPINLKDEEATSAAMAVFKGMWELIRECESDSRPKFQRRTFLLHFAVSINCF